MTKEWLAETFIGQQTTGSPVPWMKKFMVWEISDLQGGETGKSGMSVTCNKDHNRVNIKSTVDSSSKLGHFFENKRGTQ